LTAQEEVETVKKAEDLLKKEYEDKVQNLTVSLTAAERDIDKANKLQLTLEGQISSLKASSKRKEQDLSKARQSLLTAQEEVDTAKKAEDRLKKEVKHVKKVLKNVDEIKTSANEEVKSLQFKLKKAENLNASIDKDHLLTTEHLMEEKEKVDNLKGVKDALEEQLQEATKALGVSKDGTTLDYVIKIKKDPNYELSKLEELAGLANLIFERYSEKDLVED
jgi:chromosome segregation ATPase